MYNSKVNFRGILGSSKKGPEAGNYQRILDSSIE